MKEDKKVLLIGYGSIGKRHAKNLIESNFEPHILTFHPDNLPAKFVNTINEVDGCGITHVIIASPTSKHLSGLENCLNLSKVPERILIEKPLESTYERGKKIEELSKKYNLEISVAYNLRFLNIFSTIKTFINKKKSKIRFVEIVAGQDLREWRPYKNYTESYSSKREQGGGVDLDLSHELDYALWLFGDNFNNKIVRNRKVSDLQINSPDLSKIILEYQKFSVDITLDYIRSPKERYIKIICEGGSNLYYNFVNNKLTIDGVEECMNDSTDESYKRLLNSFINGKKDTLCSLEEGLNILSILEV